jgi:hypothetical protein
VQPQVLLEAQPKELLSDAAEPERSGVGLPQLVSTQAEAAELEAEQGR